ncbi:membrane-associating domain-containing protein [Lipomyces arxii]|uniref:membrane-associating domain-containing protein n=1 Tax=Lipomyces arxii TaxID=56418 RepID=UPI0034CD207C
MGAMFITNVVLRCLLFVFLTICMGLTGSLINGAMFGNPQVNFMMFASAFGLLFGCMYGILAMFISFLAFPFVIAAIDFLVCVFAFSGATALAVAIRVHSCTNDAYVMSNKVAQNSTDRCRKAQADTVFMYFSFICALVALVVSISSAMRTGWGTLPSKSRPAAAPAPVMAQV